MFAPNVYRIRFATAEDADTLKSLAERNSQRPLVGRVLMGHLRGTPAAAMSVDEGRVIADSSPLIGPLVVTLRNRVSAIKAFEANPALSDRLRAAFASYDCGATVVQAPVSGDQDDQDEPMRIAA
jgi:hypothetical protein